ncbi:MAG: Ig-like domain-containing protein, partial [Prevotella sp.]|nr:Ig-like domain-containing protein [Prevotella sp.]
GEDASATVALSGKGIALYTVSWKVNGADYNEGNPSTDVIDGSKVTSLPTAPSAINGKVFVGWTDTEISTSQDNAPSVLFNTASSAPAVTAKTTYYAVFASQSEGAPVVTLSQTLAYDTWTYSGSTTDKSSYRLFHNGSYIESAEFDLSTLSKVVVYGGTFGGTSYNKLNIGDGTNTWKDVTVSGNSETGKNTYTDGTALSGIGKLRITSKSGTASDKGVRISKVEIYNTQCGYTYSGYATTINTATLTGISVSGPAADLWKGDDFTHEGITVTATYDDASTADVTSFCTYSGCDMSTAGSQTVTVSYGGKEATYDVTVKTIGNTKETAYTVSKAIELIDAGNGLKTPVYVKGKVSEIVTAFSSEYGNITFNVSEDGTTEGAQFQFFRNVKGADNEKYTSENECPKVGDKVIGYGKLTKYNTTYEFSEDNYLVEKTVSTNPSSNLTLSQTTGEVNVDKTLDIHSYVSTAVGYTGKVIYAVTTGAEYASVSEAGVITGLAVGTATVKVTAPAVVGAFSESSAEFSVTVVDNRTATTVTFGSGVDGQTFSVNLGGTFVGKTATVSPAEAGNVTYSSDNTDVASVDENGAITLGGIAGTATITASFVATDDYKASSAKYYINVIDPNGPVFYESFNQNKGTGGNNGIWNNISKKPTLICDNSGWTDKNVSGADKCAIFGTSSAKGTATTPAINLSEGKYILTFKAGAWNAKDEKTAIDVVISDGELTYNGKSLRTQTIEMNKGAWTDYTMTIAGATNNATITFTAKVNSDNRFFLDEVKIVKAAVTSTLSLVAEDNGIYYATFSSSEAVIFSSDVDVEVDAVSVKGSTLNIAELAKGDYFVKATSADGFDVVSNGYYVPANTGVLIQSLKNSVTYYYPYEAATVSLPANQLKPAPAEGGVFTPEPGDHWYYKLAYNKYDTKTGLGFYWGEENGGVFYVKAGTAYLAVPSTSGNVKGFSFDGTSTGISAVDAEEPAKTRVIYNIAGQKVNAMTKAGLYIVNGKKIVIRK